MLTKTLLLTVQFGNALTLVMAGIVGLRKTADLSLQVRSRDCFNYTCRVMKFMGWLPPEQGTLRYIHLFWAVVVFLSGGVCMPIGLLLSLIVNFKSLTIPEFIRIFLIFLNELGFTIKIIIVFIYFSRFREISRVLDKMDERLQNGRDRYSIHSAVARCNYVVLVYGIVYWGCGSSAIIVCAFTERPPWMVFNPLFDWRQGSIEFLMQTFLEQMMAYTVTAPALVLDTINIIRVMIFRAHVGVLKNRIYYLRRNPLATDAENYEDVKNCIKDHNMILKCCNLMRPIISYIMLVHFLSIGSVLGFFAVYMMNLLDIFQVIQAISYLAAVLIQTFPFCYLCDLLAEDSNELSNLLAHSNWIDAEPKYKSTLIIFMHQLQQPITFIAGGIIPISMNSSMKLTKFAFSVMAIMEKINLADRLNNK